MKTAIYLRVARCNDQDAKLTKQLQDCHNWIDDNGDSLTQTYEDYGVDGMTLDREALDHLFRDAQKGYFKRVVMAHPSVMARGAQTFDAIRARFLDAGLTLVFVEPGGTIDAPVPVVDVELLQRRALAASATSPVTAPGYVSDKVVANDGRRYFE